MPLQTETVAIPITSGLNLTSEARLIEPPKLLEATNARFSRGGGSRKRRGHRAVTVRNSSSIPPGTAPTDTSWLFGWGYVVSSNRDETLLCGTSSHPNAGRLYGVAQRDRETVLWTGHSLLSYTPAEAGYPPGVSSSVGNAVMPALTATPIAKVSTSQIAPDLADNGVIKVVAWLDAGTTKVHYSVYDSVSSALIVSNAALSATSPYQVRAVPLGTFVHLLVTDTDDTLLKLYTINQQAPSLVIERDLGPCDKYFDVWKFSDTSAVIAKSNGTLDVSWITQDGTAYGNPPLSVTATGALDLVACTVHPVSSALELAWQSGGNIYSANYVLVSGAWTGGTPVPVASTTTARRLTLAPKYLYGSTGAEVYDIYFDAASNKVHKQRVTPLAVVSGVLTRYNLVLVSTAFRVGDRTYAWLAHPSSLQSTYFLADEALNPIGHQDFAIAHAASNDTFSGIEAGIGVAHLTSVNWAGTATSNQVLFHLALGYNVRVPTSSSTSAVFAEPSVKETRLNFLPPFRVAQAGRALYFAGAQVWSYDGAALTEAGFHIGPEITNITTGGGGTLTALGTYFYRVDICYKNAQGEEIRSLSILTTPTTLAGTDKTLTMTIPTCYTARTDSYLLIYRNAMASGIPLTNLWLLNSRDPTSAHFIPNDQTVASITFVDNGSLASDANIQKNELHPANSGDSYLQPIAAPACEIISAGRDRIWVAGGELLPGQVAPSRLFEPGDTPAWNPYLNIQVDRSSEALTAVGFVGEVAVFFRKNSTYVMDGDGPDNVTNGTWAPSRLAFADLGALGQESLALISPGLLFQGPAGIRLMSPSGSLQPLGMVVDEFAKGFSVTKAVVIDHDQEVRFYGPTGALVYNYLYDAWSFWTLPAAGAVRDFVTGLAVVAKTDGTLLLESDDLWTDGGKPYTHRIRFPWLHAGSLGDFQRVRSIEGIGTWDINDGYHTIRVEIFYDERAFAEEVFQWQMPHPINALSRPLFFPLGGDFSTWGDAHWGDGIWGDSESSAGEIHDHGWDWKRRLHRQKCAVISIAIEDWGTLGPGFTLNAICLNLAKKPGLNRLPGVSTGSDTYR